MPYEEIRFRLDKAATNLVNLIREELIAEGHDASGELVNSMSYTITVTSERVFAEVRILDYALILDAGVPASSVPFSADELGRRGGTSAYIAGLLDWMGDIGIVGEQEKLGFAMRIARVAAIEGHPTSGAYAFTSNGRRTGWIEEIVQTTAPSMERDLDIPGIVRRAYDRLAERLAKLFGKR